MARFHESLEKIVLDFYMTSILVILIEWAQLWTIPEQMPLFSRFHDRYYNRKSISAEARFSGMSHQWRHVTWRYRTDLYRKMIRSLLPFQRTHNEPSTGSRSYFRIFIFFLLLRNSIVGTTLNLYFTSIIIIFKLYN